MIADAWRRGVRVMIKASRVKAQARAVARRLGYDISRWPSPNDITAHLVRVIRRYEIDGVIDVGANVGDWVLELRAAGYHGPVLSIEPLPDEYGRLRRRAQADDRWTTMQAAVGDATGKAELNVARASQTSSLLPVDDYFTRRFPDAEQVRSVTVDVVTLDQIADRLPGARRLLKTDTQGYDMHVIDGAKRTLESVIAVECELSVIPNYVGMTNDWIDMFHRMTEEGFELSGMFGHGRSDPALRQSEMDGVFVRPDRLPTDAVRL